MNKSINLRHQVSREEVDGLKVGVNEIFISCGGAREFLTKIRYYYDTKCYHQN